MKGGATGMPPKVIQEALQERVLGFAQRGLSHNTKCGPQRGCCWWKRQQGWESLACLEVGVS